MPHRIPALAASVREKYDADIILYVGRVARPKDDVFIDECQKKKSRKNVILAISTYGGDAHAAYRIARTLQKFYGTGHEHGKGDGKVYVFVSSVCWSAGTLLAMGADELILSSHAELGPIDVQLKKPDEVGEIVSGLTPIQALDYLQGKSREMFVNVFNSMRFERGFSTATASKIASDLAAGLLGKLYEQIDPIRVAEVYRALSIAEHYGTLIGRNLCPGSLQKLLYGYPAHTCVIDSTEARTLFQSVSEPTPELDLLGIILKEETQQFLTGKDPQVGYRDEPTTTEPPNEKHRAKKSGLSKASNGVAPPRRKSETETSVRGHR
jgi:hypothetical protein